MTMMQRVLWAWFAAALMPGIALSLYLLIMSGGFDLSLLVFVTLLTTPITFIIASLHILILGLPLFYKLETLGRLNLWTSALSGLIIAGTPFLLLSLMNAPTSQWPPMIMSIYSVSGFFGIIGGISAWCVWRYTAPKEIVTETIP
ncbi:hypothetical protein [Asticcacaulis machinosus]|uniref:Uncharacterized protein n=1 Tax=Asticcacaulis machinosus TaxID=2984211 RepID=A0ABT5HFP4_9CAUL|nr:hypothetical protein [Asticcacaulis machinosus]MDC7675077.1 hypothetical protein [Asticcacaulis machinosus]